MNLFGILQGTSAIWKHYESWRALARGIFLFQTDLSEFTKFLSRGKESRASRFGRVARLTVASPRLKEDHPDFLIRGTFFILIHKVINQ